MNREGLIQHLTADKAHHVLSYGPETRPEDLDVAELAAWHDADHAGDEGVGPRDGHTHE